VNHQPLPLGLPVFLGSSGPLAAAASFRWQLLSGHRLLGCLWRTLLHGSTAWQRVPSDSVGLRNLEHRIFAGWRATAARGFDSGWFRPAFRPFDHSGVAAAAWRVAARVGALGVAALGRSLGRGRSSLGLGARGLGGALVRGLCPKSCPSVAAAGYVDLVPRHGLAWCFFGTGIPGGCIGHVVYVLAATGASPAGVGVSQRLRHPQHRPAIISRQEHSHSSVSRQSTLDLDRASAAATPACFWLAVLSASRPGAGYVLPALGAFSRSCCCRALRLLPASLALFQIHADIIHCRSRPSRTIDRLRSGASSTTTTRGGLELLHR